MDLHLYRSSEDRWRDLRSEARGRGAVLAFNALTLDELVDRITPDLQTATAGQRLALGTSGPADDHPGSQDPDIAGGHRPLLQSATLDALAQLKAAQIRPADLRAVDATGLAEVLEKYDRGLGRAGLADPQDRRTAAASRVGARAVPWLERFQRVVLHALYDLTESEFRLVQSLIEVLPEGGAVMLFNSTANVKPTQFAEWTWQRFIQDESLAEKTFPEFCRSSNPSRAILERLFVFEPGPPLPADDSLRLVKASGRYKEVEIIAAEICDLIARNENPGEIAVVVRHIETYGEMIEDVFSRYGIVHAFETGLPLIRIPFIKYWLALLDLVTDDRSRGALARVMSSAYFEPRLSPGFDVERILAACGYIDRNHRRASALAARKNSSLAPEIERFEERLDALEHSHDSVLGFLQRLQPAALPADRDRRAWRSLAEELEAIERLSLGEIAFAEFRRLASEVAGIRTVERHGGAAAAPGLPRVRIIGTASLGYRDYRWIFAPGIADGEFPARLPANPLLPDDVVDALNRRQRQRRLMTSRDRSRREPLYLFMLLDSATRRVILTYPAGTLEGEPIYPSVYVGEVARHFAPETVSVRPPDPGFDIRFAEAERLQAIANEWRIGMVSEERAKTLLGEDIVRRTYWEAKGIRRAHVSKGTLSLDGVWSPSELNALSGCAFVFLAKHRLKLRALETPDYEVPAAEVGIFAHNILRDFYLEPVPASREEALRRMDTIIERRLSAADVSGQGPYSVFDPALWNIRRRQLVSVMHAYVDFAVRDARDGFATRIEYLDSALPPAQIGGIVLGGRPDHVAVHRSNGSIDAIRVDDFKYSAASSATSRLLKQSFQVPIYSHLAVQALGAGPHVRLEGRYLLLRSPGNPVVAHPIGETIFDDVRERVDTLLEIVRDGRLAPHPVDRQDCAECDYRRLCRLYGS